MNKTAIPTYIVNLESRPDRKAHILQEFAGHDEFDLSIVAPLPAANGAVSLWNTIKHILQNLVSEDADHIILCEDDHLFTNAYDPEELRYLIAEAAAMQADVLSGGVSWLTSCLQVSENMCWMERFSGLQFTVLFRKFFPAILNAVFDNGDAADYKISSLTGNKYFIYPFISTQKDFGYSDVTSKNNNERRVEELFKTTAENIQILQNVARYYDKRKQTIDQQIPAASLENLTLSTYVISLPERTERRSHIQQQFAQREEFDVTIVDAIRHEKGNLGLWLGIRNIIQLAMDNDDDVVIICEDDHQFTPAYTKEMFLETIIKAHELGVEMLCGGIGGFGTTIPVTEHTWWINSFMCTQFMVLYRSLFSRILSEPYDEDIVVEDLYSSITSNKLTFFPFISVQKNFGGGDIAPVPGRVVCPVSRLFEQTENRFLNIQSSMPQQALTTYY